MMWRRGLAVVTLLGTVAACSAILGIDDLPAAEGANQSDASSDSGTPDDSSTGDSAVNGGDGAVNPNAPRLLAPLSTSHVTSRTPTLHWVLPAGVTDVTLDLCHDRACSNPITLGIAVTGPSYKPTTQLPTGVVFWRTHAGTNTSPTWEFWVGARSAPSVDTSWGTTLDVNGDGRPDVAVANINLRVVNIYLGTDTGLSSTPGASLTTTIDSTFGISVTGAGDVNGDGYGDLLIAGLYNVFVYLGSKEGVVPAPYAVFADISGPKYIYSPLSLGDVNGDGYADIGFSGRVHLPDGGQPFGVNVFYGGVSALASDVPDGGYFKADLGLTDFGARDPYSTSRFGLVMAAADVNGDGLGDLLATSFYAGDGGSPGAVYLYDGNLTGLPTTASGEYDGFQLTGPERGCSSSADLNGDGYGDLVEGASALTVGYDVVPPVSYLSPIFQFNYADSGAQEFDYGYNVGDVNGDGIADAVVYVGAQAQLYLVLGGVNHMNASSTPLPPSFGMPWPAGDINGDGLGDVWETQSATVNLYYGSAAGLALAPDGGLVPVASFPGTNVFGSTN